MKDKAITLNEFSLILSENNFLFEDSPHIGVCVSGGVDSMALLLLMNSWIKKKEGKITVIHFNHNFRKESFSEATLVKKKAKELEHDFKILNWSKEKPKNSIMKEARDARYESILKYCKKKRIITLMTAHHLDDTLETYIMRKERKYSTLGLTAIPGQNYQENIQILRPLLDIRKLRLLKTCIKKKSDWVNDPSNKNEKFERVRIREYLKNLNQDRQKRIESEFKLQLKKNLKIEKRISEYFINKLQFLDSGQFIIERRSLLYLPRYLQIEILKKLLVTCSGSVYPPKNLSLRDLLYRIKNLEKLRYSIHSCIIDVKINEIRLFREYKKIKETVAKSICVKKGESILWDNRYKISSELYDLTCQIMTENKWLRLKRYFKDVKNFEKIKFEIIKTLPLIKIQKTFFIPFLSSESEFNKRKISVLFHPKIPLTKKNF
ncbi:MAG: tRNA lysidine(34) synthetase TilS [Pseudomonadota bacterium]|nr:tRNA lysidine(34) synthetase TilS [Pseudomonadota bacterium]